VLTHLETFLGSSLAREIPDQVDAYVMHRRREGARPATIRLELGVLAAAFKVARLPRLELPTIEVRNTRQGFLEPEEVKRITRHLPSALKAAVRFAFLTGWRKSEVLGLEWRSVDLAAGFVRLEPGTTKSGRGRVFPFGSHPDLARLLREQRDATAALERATGQIARWVFHREGAPIRDMDDAWKAACRKAGLEGRIFHDLRRSAARNLRRLGLSESDIMEMCGWETRAMFQRYAIQDEAGLSERLGRALSGTTSAQTALRERAGAVD
jgi:integrase